MNRYSSLDEATPLAFRSPHLCPYADPSRWQIRHCHAHIGSILGSFSSPTILSLPSSPSQSSMLLSLQNQSHLLLARFPTDLEVLTPNLHGVAPPFLLSHHYDGPQAPKRPRVLLPHRLACLAVEKCGNSRRPSWLASSRPISPASHARPESRQKTQRALLTCIPERIEAKRGLQKLYLLVGSARRLRLLPCTHLTLSLPSSHRETTGRRPGPEVASCTIPPRDRHSGGRRPA